MFSQAGLLRLADGGIGDDRAIRRRGNLEEIALASVRAGGEKARGAQAVARDEDARASCKAAREAVRLVADDGGDAEELVAKLELIADLEMEPNEEIIGDDDGVSL